MKRVTFEKLIDSMMVMFFLVFVVMLFNGCGDKANENASKSPETLITEAPKASGKNLSLSSQETGLSKSADKSIALKERRKDTLKPDLQRQPELKMQSTLREMEKNAPKMENRIGNPQSPSPVMGDFKEKKIAAIPQGVQPGAVDDGTSPDAVRGTRPDEFNTEAYDNIVENPFILVANDPLSTFSIDVDTASYSNIRRFLTQNTIPPKDSVRIEEMINYFVYDYPQPTDEHPFSINVEIAACPWNLKHRLTRIGLKGREIAMDKRPPSNLVFLLDVSGSMNAPNKLPLLKAAFKMLVEKLGENDRVAIAVYAGNSGLVLPSTCCDKKEAIIDSLDRLQAGGSTNAGSGIQLAYNTAVENFIKGGTNRVILATDGDFNVGITNQGDLVRFIEQKAKSGVFLTVLGFGMGNYKDSTLEKLADKGNGNYSYIDNIKEAQKALVEQACGTLVTIAKDVKIQIEFNPGRVAAFRLVGYENRVMRHEDFKDDTKDAGEIGAGHTVTALYELIPAGENLEIPGVDSLKYQKKPELSEASKSGEAMTVKLRYKKPDGDKSTEIVVPVIDEGKNYTKASPDFKFAASVASFGMILRDSKYKADANFDGVLELSEEGIGKDTQGYRKEFIELVKTAKNLMKK